MKSEAFLGHWKPASLLYSWGYGTMKKIMKLLWDMEEVGKHILVSSLMSFCKKICSEIHVKVRESLQQLWKLILFHSIFNFYFLNFFLVYCNSWALALAVRSMEALGRRQFHSLAHFIHLLYIISCPHACNNLLGWHGFKLVRLTLGN